jgi:hypothetical protein
LSDDYIDLKQYCIKCNAMTMNCVQPVVRRRKGVVNIDLLPLCWDCFREWSNYQRDNSTGNISRTTLFYKWLYAKKEKVTFT